MRHIFGPVPSRRLGLSLGLDIVPFKTCTLDCVYCECGPTTRKTLKRKKYVRTRELMKELEDFLARGIKPDYITFSGSGEPTLNTELGRMIRRIKKMTGIPVAVLTNGTLLYKKSVQNDLLPADLVKPSLDAALLATFMRINRPHPRLRLSRMIRGMIRFRKRFKGQLWLEIFFIQGINDSPGEISALIALIKKIAPDRVQLNTLDRPPAEPSVRPVASERMDEIREMFYRFGLNAEIIHAFKRETVSGQLFGNRTKEQILNFIRRRPETERNIAQGLSLSVPDIHRWLAEMQKEGLVEAVSLPGSPDPYYRARTVS